MPLCLYIVIFSTCLFILFKIISNIIVYQQSVIATIPFDNIDLAWKIITSYELYHLWYEPLQFLEASDVNVLHKINCLYFEIIIANYHHNEQIWQFFFDKETNILTIKKILPYVLKWYQYFSYSKNQKEIALLAANFKKAEQNLLS